MSNTSCDLSSARTWNCAVWKEAGAPQRDIDKSTVVAGAPGWAGKPRELPVPMPELYLTRCSMYSMLEEKKALRSDAQQPSGERGEVVNLPLGRQFGALDTLPVDNLERWPICQWPVWKSEAVANLSLEQLCSLQSVLLFYTIQPGVLILPRLLLLDLFLRSPVWMRLILPQSSTQCSLDAADSASIFFYAVQSGCV